MMMATITPTPEELLSAEVSLVPRPEAEVWEELIAFVCEGGEEVADV